jgi:uncharacterized protein (DUF2384 family)
MPKSTIPADAQPLPDPTTKPGRTALAKMITRLFDRWDLDSREQAALLGLSSGTRSTVSRYRKGAPLPLHQDLLDRVGHLLGIHLALRLIFPQNRQLAYSWIKTPNRRFDGKTPLEVMLGEGFLGVVMVRRYLDFERGR